MPNYFTKAPEYHTKEDLIYEQITAVKEEIDFYKKKLQDKDGCKGMWQGLLENAIEHKDTLVAELFKLARQEASEAFEKHAGGTNSVRCKKIINAGGQITGGIPQTIKSKCTRCQSFVGRKLGISMMAEDCVVKTEIGTELLNH